MPVEIKRVAYGFNSALEDSGVDAYFFDCLVIRDGHTVVDRHESFKSAEAIQEAIEGVVPILSLGDIDENWED